jgi:hypothetical protein
MPPKRVSVNASRLAAHTRVSDMQSIVNRKEMILGNETKWNPWVGCGEIMLPAKASSQYCDFSGKIQMSCGLTLVPESEVYENAGDLQA